LSGSLHFTFEQLEQYCPDTAIVDGRLTRGRWLALGKFQPCAGTVSAEEANERANEARDQMKTGGA
jgi:hypothetical protein